VTAEQNVVTVEGNKADKTERDISTGVFPHGHSSGNLTSLIMFR
jgi:hypothetical protein